MVRMTADGKALQRASLPGTGNKADTLVWESCLARTSRSCRYRIVRTACKATWMHKHTHIEVGMQSETGHLGNVAHATVG